MEEAATFLFIGAAVVALFTFLTASHWISTRSAERMYRERLALLRKVVEQPAPTAELMRELLREEEARAQTQARQKARQARHDGLQGGVTVLAIGVGLSTFLYAIAPGEPVWTIGIMIVLIGAVTTVFAYFHTPGHLP